MNIPVKCIEKRENIYFILSVYGDLIKYNELVGEYTFLANIWREGNFFCTSCMIGEKIFFFSYYGNDYCIYHTDEDYIEYRAFNLKNHQIEGSISSVIYRNKIYVIVKNADIKIICIDPYNYTTIPLAINQKNSIRLQDVSNIYTCLQDGKLIIPTTNPDCIYEYDLNNNEEQIHTIDKMGIVYNTVVFDGKNFWLTGDSKKIVCWNREKNVCIMVIDLEDYLVYRNENLIDNYLFAVGIFKDNRIYYAPLQSNSFISYDIQSGRITVMKKMEEWEYCNSFFDVSENELYALINSFLKNDKDMLEINNCSVKEIRIVNEKQYDELLENNSKYFLKNSKLIENNQKMIKWYIKKLCEL